MTETIQLEPVLAYDRIAPSFQRLSKGREAYLAAVERLVALRIPPGAASLLDIGAGDGRRAQRIAQAAGVNRLVLLEPSAQMRNQWAAGLEGWPLRAEQLVDKNDSFDNITCLWNVLGHIFPRANRVDVLRNCNRLLSPQGLLFVDVNYRYNARHYGFIRTFLRLLKDRLQPRDANGDVIVRWNVDGSTYATQGHVFTHAEFREDARLAGLAVEERYSIDYRTGALRKLPFSGHLLYVLRKGRL